MAKAVKGETKNDNVPMMAAGIAFYSFLALIPALAAIVAVYGLIVNPSAVAHQVQSSLGAAPKEVRALMVSQLTDLAKGSSGAALTTAIISGVIAVWSASGAMGHLIDALNIAYDTNDDRGWFRQKLLSLAFTAGAVVFLALSLAVIALVPSLLAKTGLGTAARIAAGLVRWLLLGAGLLIGLNLLYRCAPRHVRPPRRTWRWASPGAWFAVGVWLVASVAFSIYTANFGRYNKTYGSLGALVIVLIWFEISAWAVILGGEINATLIEDGEAHPLPPPAP